MQKEITYSHGSLLKLITERNISDPVSDNYSDIAGYSYLYDMLQHIRDSIISTSKGELDFNISGKGFILGSLKSLQASLKHLTWQTKAIASGDFSQKVDFLGEFSEAFNSMTQKLQASINNTFGVAACYEGCTSDSIVSRADEALYLAKRSGKNRVIVGVL